MTINTMPSLSAFGMLNADKIAVDEIMQHRLNVGSDHSNIFRDWPPEHSRKALYWPLPNLKDFKNLVVGHNTNRIANGKPSMPVIVPDDDARRTVENMRAKLHGELSKEIQEATLGYGRSNTSIEILERQKQALETFDIFGPAALQHLVDDEKLYIAGHGLDGEEDVAAWLYDVTRQDIRKQLAKHPESITVDPQTDLHAKLAAEQEAYYEEMPKEHPLRSAFQHTTPAKIAETITRHIPPSHRAFVALACYSAQRRELLSRTEKGKHTSATESGTCVGAGLARELYQRGCTEAEVKGFFGKVEVGDLSGGHHGVLLEQAPPVSPPERPADPAWARRKDYSHTFNGAQEGAANSRNKCDR